MSGPSTKQQETFSLSIQLSGPLHHDLKQANAHVLDALAMFAVKHRLALEEAVANFTGVRQKNGHLYATYTVRRGGERSKG